MERIIDISELPRRWEEALAAVEAGQEIVLSRKASPVARLVPCAPRERVLGLHPGAIQPSADFDAPLPEEFWAGQP
ncbi:MAG: type II toxin-antitoxin system prevent-host-death family antitoxin [Gemmataceae bacterium]|nr:type II toxin-antitoxin system prevent-host-death family antitoxin [Gemmataceae bacterium]